jgi:hypothetical protein
MFQASADESGRLLTLNFSRDVAAAEMQRCLGTIRDLLNTIQPGFQMLTDLSDLGSMESECAPFVGEIMDLCNAKGVKTDVRVVPDPHKDIGYNLLSHFHYDPNVTVQTHDNLADALQSLSP